MTSRKTKYQSLFVDRKGISDKAFMITRKIVDELYPNQSYQIQDYRLAPTAQPSSSWNTHIVVPNYCHLEGNWHHPKEANHPTNILGGIGSFLSTHDRLEIPLADTTPGNLAYYNARFIAPRRPFRLDVKEPLPLFDMEIGERYVEDYMMSNQHAGGVYLEYHTTPHFHMCLNPQSKGYLILGKKVSEGLYHISAFSIPCGSGIYTAPGTIHNDSFLVGRYLVVYTKTDQFSTVRLLGSNGAMLRVGVEQEGYAPSTSQAVMS